MGNRTTRSSTLLSLTALLAVVFSVVLLPLPVQAQEALGAPAPAVQVSAQADGVVLTLDLPAVAAAADDVSAFPLPLVRYGGYNLPMQTLTLALPNAQAPQIDQQVLAASKFSGVLTPAEPQQPPALEATPNLNLEPESLRLPQQPVFVLRSGQIRGQHYAVIAVSPLFERNGQVQVATQVKAGLAGAVLAGAAANAAGAVAQNETVNVPVNDAALKSSFKLTVSSPGIQEVRYADLGLGAEPAAVRVALNGQPVAVEKLSDRLRFHAATVGDRWNATSTYWLTLEAGPLIQARAAAPDAAQGFVFEQGRWVDNKLYDSFYPGADGDHWFNKDMRADPSMEPAAYPTATVPATTVLPLRDGDSSFTVNTTAFVRAPGGLCLAGDKGYKLEAQMRSGPNALDAPTVTWDPAPNCILAPTNALTFTTTARTDSLRLRLLPNDQYGTGIKLESVDWLRPVTLDFTGVAASNIDFWTEAGPWTYTWANLPKARSLYLPLIVAPGNAAAAGTLTPATGVTTRDFVFEGSQWQLYDVTDPANPLLVPATTTGFNQGPEAARRHYLLSNLSLPLRPAITRHSATDFSNVKAADAIYIGPAGFADALKPLLALRQQQGHTPLFVDVQAIYDVYGFGQISAPAIRNFLRSHADWQNPARKISVVLVGDATYDPLGFEGPKNSILVAAWIDDVDPFMGETACDTCFAQLNGDDPKSGDYTPGGPPWFAADIWLGRFPVRSVEELTDVVAKIVSYETTGSDGDSWRARQVYLADNYIKAMDSQLNARPDDAGDFAALSDAVVQRVADGAVIRRIYYDPAPQRKILVDGNGPVPAPGKPGYFVTRARPIAESWRQSDASAANIAAVQYLSSGAGLFVYNGHANHFQFATTSENKSDPLRWLLYTNDVGFINNQGKPFIQLSMTCYTSMFIKPTFNGTLDELIFRRKDAGAVAIWGPTGQSVVNGHQLLTEGFINRLYATAATQPVGQLIEAGYTNLLLANTSYLDPLMTFVLLGDPLTPARITARQLYLPAVQK